MNTERDVLSVAIEVGEAIWVHAEGNPALILTGAVAVAFTAIGYGTYKYGHKFVEWIGA